jgi:DNA-binding MurR/RpiR family transcriptional regulator
MILYRIQADQADLPEALGRIAATILADPAAAARLTSPVLAERSATAPAAVTRFCRHFGFSGYRELRHALATENAKAEQAGWDMALGHRIDPETPLETVIGSIAVSDARLIQQTAAALDPATVMAVTEAIATASRILICGSSVSGLIAQLIAGQLRRIGLPSWSHPDAHEALADAALAKPRDVVIAVSHEGRTREGVEILRIAAESGATTVAVTSFPRSPLASVADHVLLTGVHETAAEESISLSAVHSQIYVLDIVNVAVTQRLRDSASHAFKRTLPTLEARRLESE